MLRVTEMTFSVANQCLETIREKREFREVEVKFVKKPWKAEEGWQRGALLWVFWGEVQTRGVAGRWSSLASARVGSRWAGRPGELTAGLGALLLGKKRTCHVVCGQGSGSVREGPSSFVASGPA